jgi:hypothetical protein
VDGERQLRTVRPGQDQLRRDLGAARPVLRGGGGAPFTVGARAPRVPSDPYTAFIKV